MVFENKLDFAAIEEKWQKKWADKKVFEVAVDKDKQKYYLLEMYPYPSASGLHLGHALNYFIGDIFARFKKLQGFNVLHPMGFDSFGLPAENAAIKNKSHPKKFTEQAIEGYTRQMKSLGLSYDWTRLIQSHDPRYYKWDQWIFLKMFEKGLAYKKKSPVNWCTSCNTVLANEQVINGRCWRHEDQDVDVKNLEQWFFKTTAYADELYEGLNKLDHWPEIIKNSQRNWIGKSQGCEVDFEINGKIWTVFTTRPDTLFGVSFLVVSAQHPELMNLVSEDNKEEVKKFIKKQHSVKQEDIDQLTKEGVFTGSYALHPLTGDKIPVWVGNFVLAEYGSGMIMAVPAHDQRDFDFAKKYGLDIRPVISPINGTINSEDMEKAFTDSGILINSRQFDSLESEVAKDKIVQYLVKLNKGRLKINFKLRDWLISRQRFWGTPIPIINCTKCGFVPVPEKDLPVLLPEDVKFDNVENPLKSYSEFINCTCPKCGGDAKRESDTMDTFVNSSWYYLRYTDPQNEKAIFDSDNVNYWCPIDLYIGGKEHACLHLIYSRFYTKFLRDIGLLKFDEPAVRLFNQGMLLGPDGTKMSKSKGNVILPESVSEKYGLDSARMFLVSVANPDKDINWSSDGVDGSLRFIKKLFSHPLKFSKSSNKVIEHVINKGIKEVGNDIENLRYNLAVIRLREIFDRINGGECSKNDFEKFLILLNPICPHVTEEIWSKLGNKKMIVESNWPEFEDSKIDEKLDKIFQSVEKTVSDIKNILGILKEKDNREVEKIYLYLIPNEFEFYNIDELQERIGKKIVAFKINDKLKYDPEGKSSKAKPGKPAIYVE